jgi:hypothetical protein
MCAQKLHQRWVTIDAVQLEEVAMEIWKDERLRSLPPDEAASLWLAPVVAKQAGG